MKAIILINRTCLLLLNYTSALIFLESKKLLTTKATSFKVIEIIEAIVESSKGSRSFVIKSQISELAIVYTVQPPYTRKPTINKHANISAPY